MPSQQYYKIKQSQPLINQELINAIISKHFQPQIEYLHILFGEENKKYTKIIQLEKDTATIGRYTEGASDK